MGCGSSGSSYLPEGDDAENGEERYSSKNTDDPELDEDVDPNSRSAKMALRRASSFNRNRNIRASWVMASGEDAMPPEDFDWNSPGAELAFRKFSKDKVQHARRISAEVDGDENTLKALQNIGVDVCGRPSVRNSVSGPGRGSVRGGSKRNSINGAHMMRAKSKGNESDRSSQANVSELLSHVSSIQEEPVTTFDGTPYSSAAGPYGSEGSRDRSYSGEDSRDRSYSGGRPASKDRSYSGTEHSTSEERSYSNELCVRDEVGAVTWGKPVPRPALSPRPPEPRLSVTSIP